MLLESTKARLPLPLLLGDPTAQRLQAFDVQPARSPLAVDPLMDQLTASEYADVVRDGLVRQVEWLGELADGRLAPRQSGKDRPAGPVPEGGEGGIQFGVDAGRSSHGADRICKALLAQMIDEVS